MFSLNHLKLRKNNSRAIDLCIVISLCIFSQTIGYSLGADFQIIAEENDILMYKLTFDDEVSYAKFNVNKTYENSTSILISYNAYFAENLTGFNETDVLYTNTTLTGNAAENILGSGSIFNLILPIGTNFSNSESDMQEYFTENEEDIMAEYTIGVWGYSINIAYYVRFVVLIKVVEITYYYSTTGVLLLGDYYFKNPTSTDTSSGYFEILPENSTVSGADENPYNPANISVSESTDDETFDKYKKFKLDTKGIITIVLGSLAFIGLAVLSVYLIKRNRKN